MKNFLVLVALMVGSMSIAQEKIAEGVLVQSQTISSSNEEMNAQLAMMGEMITTTHFKGDKSYSKLSNPMMGTTITVIDNVKKEILTLNEHPMMGNTYSQKNIEEEKSEGDSIEVTESSETKVILGYDCQRYDVNLVKQGQKVKMVVYATDKLSIVTNKDTTFGDKLKGFPLSMEVHVSQGGADMVIKIETTSVVAEKVADSKFDMTVPEGYEKKDGMSGM